MKHWKILSCIALILFLSGCQKEEDFWTHTIDAVEDRLQNNQYREGAWDIGVENSSQAEDSAHRNIVIRQRFEEETQTKVIMFALQNNQGQKTVSYHYQLDTIQGSQTISQELSLTSTDEAYSVYDIHYTKTIYNYNSQDFDEAKGILTIKDDAITYDNVPLLSETMVECRQLIEDFQTEFELDYAKEEFTCLPLLPDAQSIPKLTDIAPETSTQIKYYGEPTINAKGYSLIPFLILEKETNQVEYGRYSVEQKVNESSYTGTLVARAMENCFNIEVKGDLDQVYALFLQEDQIYLYPQSMSDEDILEDVTNNQGGNASFVMSEKTE